VTLWSEKAAFSPLRGSCVARKVEGRPARAAVKAFSSERHGCKRLRGFCYWRFFSLFVMAAEFGVISGRFRDGSVTSSNAVSAS
jgi:hypothetical protein